MTHGQSWRDGEILSMTEFMEAYAKHVSRRGIPSDMAIEAIEIAHQILTGGDDDARMIAKLRGAAIRYRPAGHWVIAAHMDAIANALECRRRGV